MISSWFKCLRNRKTLRKRPLSNSVRQAGSRCCLCSNWPCLPFRCKNASADSFVNWSPDKRTARSKSLRFPQTQTYREKLQQKKIESVPQNSQTSSGKNPGDAQDLAHRFTAQYKTFRQVAGWFGNGVVKKNPFVECWFWVIFLSADGVVRNRSISTIKNRQLLP